MRFRYAPPSTHGSKDQLSPGRHSPPPAPSNLTGSTGGGQGGVEADTDSVIRGLCVAGSASSGSSVSVPTFEFTEDCAVSDFTLEYNEDCGDFTLEYTEAGEENDPSLERGGGVAG